MKDLRPTTLLNARGKGVLFLTAHFGGWEIGSFAHSLFGNPLNVVVRRWTIRISTKWSTAIERCMAIGR